MGQYENVVGPGLACKTNFSHIWNEVQEYCLAVLTYTAQPSVRKLS
jgi:hypothetical protein